MIILGKYLRFEKQRGILDVIQRNFRFFCVFVFLFNFLEPLMGLKTQPYRTLKEIKEI